MNRPHWLIIVALYALCYVSAVSQQPLSYLDPQPPLRMDMVVAHHVRLRFTPMAMDNLEYTCKQLGVVPVHRFLPYNKEQELLLENNSLREVTERLGRTYVVQYSGLASPERMAAMLMVDCGRVEVAEPWYVAQPMGIPNDPELGKQGLFRQIHVAEAWEVESGSDTMLIGISDTGVMIEHEDLREAIAINSGEIPGNNIDDDNNGYVDDYEGYNFAAALDGTDPGNPKHPSSGHGTAVAGTTGAVVNNGIGIAGIANKCKLVPLRTTPDKSGGIVYGYESLMYCAANGIQVVNCSWGSMSRSCFEADVIEYVVGKGTAVVAAAGNHSTAVPFFPASYRGVLSVGVVDSSDNVMRISGYGPTVDIMAPGEQSWSTWNNGSYQTFCCTSGSAPIVSGVLALVRNKYPALSPQLACAIVRESAVPAPWQSLAYKEPELLPMGRVDALRAVTMQLDTVISTKYDTVITQSRSGETRWSVGDTVDVWARVNNVWQGWTATSSSLPKVVGGNSRAIRILEQQNTPFPIKLDSAATSIIGPFTVVVDSATDQFTYINTMVRGALATNHPVKYNLSLPFVPTPKYRTLSNDVLRTSVGDVGRIGNTDLDKGQGAGFSYKQYCGQLYECGLLVSSGTKVVDCVRGNKGNNSHFVSRKPFAKPNPQTAILRDSAAPDSLRIGVEIEETVSIALADSAMLIMDVRIKNVSDSILNGISVAWFFDWDLGTSPVNNHTYNNTTSRNISSRVVESVLPGQPHAVTTVSSSFTDAQAISSGINNTLTYSGFSIPQKLQYLQNDTPNEYTDTNDVSTIVGMRFTDKIMVGGYRTLRLVIVIDEQLQRAISLANQVSEKNTAANPSEAHLLISPNPTNQYTMVTVVPSSTWEITTADIATFTIVNTIGQQVLQTTTPLYENGISTQLHIQELPSGSYTVVYSDTKGNMLNGNMVVVR